MIILYTRQKLASVSKLSYHVLHEIFSGKILWTCRILPGNILLYVVYCCLATEASKAKTFDQVNEDLQNSGTGALRNLKYIFLSHFLDLCNKCKYLWTHNTDKHSLKTSHARCSVIRALKLNFNFMFGLTFMRTTWVTGELDTTRINKHFLQCLASELCKWKME